MSKSEKRIEAAEGSNQPRFCARSRGGLAIMDTKNAVAALFRLKRANTDLQFHWRSTKMSCPMKPRGLRVNCISPTVLTESAAYPARLVGMESLLPRAGEGVGVRFSNPQSNPQKIMSCMACRHCHGRGRGFD